MHSEMGRKDRALSKEEALAVLEKAEYGFLGTVSPDNEPYVVPLSFTVGGDKVYFHCARTGEKLDNITKNPSVCFCVVGPTEPVYETGFSTVYESCMVFGKAEEVTDETERREALLERARKNLPEYMDKADDAIAKTGKATAVYTISMDRVTGKAKRKKL